MDPRILDRLRCPVCGEPLAEATAGTTGALRCPRRHSFDIARQGYVNLLAGRAPHVGDSAEMVAARADFLAAGHYDLISAALSAAATEAAGRLRASPTPDFGAYPLVVDAGAGTGRYLGAVLAALPDAVGLALDVSKPALRRAARAHPRAAAALADTWQRLPLADASTAVLLNVFAPRNGPEFHRVLDPAGTLLVVTPDTDHLAELVDVLDLLRVDPDKADRVAASLGGHFTPVSSAVHRAELALTRPEVATLVGMGPSAWHTDPAALATRLAALPEPVRVTVAVRLDVLRPR
ncbi:23S rRNA (guanine(745)-N(1))-methyltransferase [Micromonospora saelicesensis]|uniref:23S rRNA (Guanine(745)-N(1))-methyltransferase n=1 Tax=Micromonospora saelicesensis TaxID=285676 RepID=A0A328NPQ9_9ACTN|nr:23S rRNA methyltransferase [Micromonospora saelicesensis]RAO30604.1 23S rRNA (guanine(745)-N(1))-methyltransferase [Micromonospora saelicesensis]